MCRQCNIPFQVRRSSLSRMILAGAPASIAEMTVPTTAATTMLSDLTLLASQATTRARTRCSCRTKRPRLLSEHPPTSTRALPCPATSISIKMPRQRLNTLITRRPSTKHRRQCTRRKGTLSHIARTPRHTTRPLRLKPHQPTLPLRPTILPHMPIQLRRNGNIHIKVMALNRAITTMCPPMALRL
jgi:hypothetical protein